MKQNSFKNPVLAFGELGLVHCLGAAGIPVYTASEKSRSVTSYSRYSTNHILFSSYNSDSFIHELCTFAESFEEKIVLMCHDDRAMLNISNNREKLKNHFLFRLPEAEMVEKIYDKLLFCSVCETYNLPAPKSLVISQSEDLWQVKTKLSAPYIIKPAYRHYWYHEDFSEIVGQFQKAFICETFDEVRELYAKIQKIHPDVVIQDYVVGGDEQLFDVNLHITPDGEIDGHVIAQKIRVYPPKAGWGSYVKTIFDEEMLQICSSIISKLKLRGLANIQFKKDERTNQPKLIEIHPRTSIFDFLGAAAGQNIPAKYYSNLTHSPVLAPGSYEADVKYINLARDLRLMIRYRKDIKISLVEWLKTYRKVSVFDGLTFKDPKVIYHELRSVFKSH